MQYALYFVPHTLEREKLALERRRLCKRFENRKAVMYPVHLTLVRTITALQYKPFVEALEEFCLAHKPIKLKVQPTLTSREGWGGVEVDPTNKLVSFQEELVQLAERFASVERHRFDPHISLVHAKNLPSLRTRTSPVKKLSLDRVTLVLQTTPGTPFRIVKHIPLGEMKQDEVLDGDDAEFE